MDNHQFYKFKQNDIILIGRIYLIATNFLKVKIKGNGSN